jgi:phosphomannomutase
MTTINELMQSSAVKFGTSGARGLVRDMTDRVCYAYTLGFIQYLLQTGQVKPGANIAIAGDLRNSTARILNACAKAIQDSQLGVIYGGQLPTPAIALYGLIHECPSIMVTGSHIPDDRNGIKFYKLSGEILKADEQLIKEQNVALNNTLFSDSGAFAETVNFLPKLDTTIASDYQQRYLNMFPDNAFAGKKVGVYQHSGVAREMIPFLLEQLGAEVVRLGYSDQFIPVDTEAVRVEDVRLAKQWTREYQLDALVSTDGDADRPLIADENGDWLRGDIVGILCARYLNIEYVVTPVSSNTCVEKSGLFSGVRRTRIGSPYVIEAMNQYLDEGKTAVAGYEANGGFLLASLINKNNADIRALPTRDAVIVLLALIHSACEQRVTLSELSKQLPQRFTFSDRIKNFATEKSRALIQKYTAADEASNIKVIEADFSALCTQTGSIKSVNTTDGLRITFANDEIIHFRPSGNAPEFRCYSEASTTERAQQINEMALQKVQLING